LQQFGANCAPTLLSLLGIRPVGPLDFYTLLNEETKWHLVKQKRHFGFASKLDKSSNAVE